MPYDSTYILGAKNFAEVTLTHHFQDECVFAFDIEFQDGNQNGGKIISGNKVPDNSDGTQEAKNFIDIDLSRTVS